MLEENQNVSHFLLEKSFWSRLWFCPARRHLTSIHVVSTDIKMFQSTVPAAFKRLLNRNKRLNELLIIRWTLTWPLIGLYKTKLFTGITVLASGRSTPFCASAQQSENRFCHQLNYGRCSATGDRLSPGPPSVLLPPLLFPLPPDLLEVIWLCLLYFN